MIKASKQTTEGAPNACNFDEQDVKDRIACGRNSLACVLRRWRWRRGGNPIQAADQFPGTRSPLFGEAADTLLITDVYFDWGDGRLDYYGTRCSHNQCTSDGLPTTTAQYFFETEGDRTSALGNRRLVRRINGVEIREFLSEDAEGNYVDYVAQLDNVFFFAGFENGTNGRRRGMGIVVGQASGHPPETTARYNGAWTWIWGGRGPNSAAAVFDYRFTSTGGEIDAFFYNAEQDLVADILGVAVNGLGKFRHGADGQSSTKID